jgi:hypothetical protein
MGPITLDLMYANFTCISAAESQLYNNHIAQLNVSLSGYKLTATISSNRFNTNRYTTQYISTQLDKQMHTLVGHLAIILIDLFITW